MSVELCFEMMKDYPPSIAASKKLGEVPEDFAWFEFEWVGEFKTTDTMKVTGAQFRVAKSGKNKGKRSIMIREGMREIYINSSEIASAKELLAA